MQVTSEVAQVPDRLRRAEQLAEICAVAAGWSDEVDRNARFPEEAIRALRDAELLGAPAPTELGGGGLSVTELAEVCATLAQSCSASAMILAMHYIQVACLVDVASKSPEIAQYLRSLTRQQRLIASVTSEVGTDGDLRRSIAGIVTDDDGRFSVSKMATTISYGQYADDLLLTVRSSSSAAEQDQRLILALGGSFRLEATTAWDTLGMRGTCSPGARVEVTGDPWQILPESFGSIASRTMVPYSHLLWSSCWTGIANDAARRARSVLRQKARKEPASAPLGGAGLVGLDCKLQLMRSDLSASLADYEAHRAATGSQMDIALSIRLNNLKLNASRLVREIVTDAMEVCGVSAYRNDSEASLARHLRDAMSATLMISNERILDANAAMLLVHKGGRGTHFLDLQ